MATTSLLGSLQHPECEAFDRSQWPIEDVSHLVVVIHGAGPLPESAVVQHVAGCDIARLIPAEPSPPRAMPTESGYPTVSVMRTPATVPDWAQVGAVVGRCARPDAALDCLIPSLGPSALRAFARGLVLGAHTTRRSDHPTRLRMWVPGAAAVATAQPIMGIACRTLLARDLGNEPANRKSPAWLSAQAEALADESLEVRVLDARTLAELGFGGVLAVGGGSPYPPNVTVMRHRQQAPGPHVVLVGKGITFDSGGLSLKPPDSMPLMKTDMTGAAAVIGTMAAIRDLGLPVRVTGVIACAENMPGGTAQRPGDVVRHFGGRTTEVLNTDAEGRLVLADCLAYAVQRLQPDVLVDLASLTGAATLGLGRQFAAMYSRDRRLARALAAAGADGGDRVWRMPLVDDYRAAIDSDIADAANTNTDPLASAGSITAALFLEPFTGNVPWAHLDIAGTARAESDRADCRKGATGFGVSLLTTWLQRRSRAARH